MKTFLIFYVLFLAISLPLSTSSFDTLHAGSSLSVENQNVDVLVSSNGVFSAGFHTVGDNAYSFAVWFTQTQPSPYGNNDRTVVWMANRDKPVNAEGSKLTLLKTGNLILNDADRIIIWATGMASIALPQTQLRLYDTGNVVLLTSGPGDDTVLWQSFSSPMDTLLPEQPLTRYGGLVSSSSKSNFFLAAEL
ncbi:putative receptor protein kinase ZmPK1 [Humulus lupulus]|uniref:putative receptor protein kinase ZmPK1 n=1 Tax=Humulus lupulus TaxID=3486 RepID=UPI002B40A9BB|nr:putative receptor protein kinase ZmPK1 [Humulus lupulus]